MRENANEHGSAYNLSGVGERKETSINISQAREAFSRRKITHVMGTIAMVLILYVVSMTLSTLGMSLKTDEDVEETSRLLVALSSKWSGNETRLRGGTIDYINRSDYNYHLSHTIRTEMEGEGVVIEPHLEDSSGIVIAGPSRSGKTILMRRLIKRRREVSVIPPTQVFYCYGSWQPSFEEMEGVTFHEGLMDFDTQLPADGKHRWVIIDDLMSESSGNKEVEDLFVKHSHHKNVSVFLLMQNFFHKGFRTITLNAHHLFLFKTRGMHRK